LEQSDSLGTYFVPVTLNSLLTLRFKAIIRRGAAEYAQEIVSLSMEATASRIVRDSLRWKNGDRIAGSVFRKVA
jgi:hypothetical protein